MALTKTLNYTQNVPVSFGFADEVSGTTETVRVCLSYDKRHGRIPVNVADFPGIIQTIDECEENQNFCFSGTEADINALLDSLMWIPATYDAANVQQNFLSLDRDCSGASEVLVESKFRFTDGANDIVIDDEVYVQGKNDLIEDGIPKKVVAVDGDVIYFYSDEAPTLYSDVIKNSDGDVYDYIVDAADNNFHGQTYVYITVYDGNDVHDNGIVTLVGEFYVKPIEFTEDPVDLIGGEKGECSDFNGGTVTQADDEYFSVQLLLKRAENDPAFDGDVLTNKPSYISDESYGNFTTVQVNESISFSYEDGEVRWAFHGTPAECTAALKNVKFIPATEKDVYVETRAVNGRFRTHKDRGIQNPVRIQIKEFEPHPLNSDGDGVARWTANTRNSTGTVNYYWEVSGSDAVIDSGQGTNQVTITFTETTGDDTVKVHCAVWDDEGSDYWTQEFNL